MLIALSLEKRARARVCVCVYASVNEVQMYVNVCSVLSLGPWVR